MERIICLAIGYCLGLIQTSYLYGKMKGIDIRQYGSGNAGTTNTLRVLGRKAGFIVLLGDILKTILAVVLATLLFGESHPDMIYLLKIYAGTGAILGHNFPFYMNFKGGKGIAATAGFILSFHPYFIVVGVILFFGAFFITNYVSLGSLLVYAGLMIQMVVCGQMGLFEGMTQPQLVEMYIVTAFLTVMAYYKHRENIKRLIRGEERKTYLKKKPQTGEVTQDSEATKDNE